jgi:NAD(P)-dependent dehydrogenase (short-subunit alcohol dehydrogenase family)
MSICSSLVHSGGGSGIGRATCEIFAREGASVAVVGNVQSDNEETVQLLKDTAKRNGHVGSKFIPFEVDVSVSSQVNAFFSSLGSSFGEGLPPSIVVNSAGIDARDTFATETESSFERIINVNLKVIATHNRH